MTVWTKPLLATCGVGLLVGLVAWPLAAQEGERERAVAERKRARDEAARERAGQRERRERPDADRRERAEAEQRERRAARERESREREGQRRRISDGRRVENAVAELRQHLNQLKAKYRELEDTDMEDAKAEVAGAIRKTEERIAGLIREFRARQAQRERGERGEREGRRPERERERPRDRRFELVVKAMQLLEEAGRKDLAHLVREHIEREHRHREGDREREHAEGRPVTIGHLREMRQFIGQLHKRVEELSERVEQLEGALEEGEREEREERDREE